MMMFSQLFISAVTVPCAAHTVLMAESWAQYAMSGMVGEARAHRIDDGGLDVRDELQRNQDHGDNDFPRVCVAASSIAKPRPPDRN